MPIKEDNGDTIFPTWTWNIHSQRDPKSNSTCNDPTVLKYIEDHPFFILLSALVQKGFEETYNIIGLYYSQLTQNYKSTLTLNRIYGISYHDARNMLNECLPKIEMMNTAHNKLTGTQLDDLFVSIATLNQEEIMPALQYLTAAVIINKLKTAKAILLKHGRTTETALAAKAKQATYSQSN